MYKKVSAAIIIMAIGSLGSISTAMAADWDIEPYFNIAEIYTDDVDLDSSFARSDFVTQATLGATVLTAGPRFNANINYGLTYLYYPDLETDKDEFRHNLAASSQSEISRDFLYFDFKAGVTQQFIDRREAFSTINISRSVNRGTLAIVDASPYIVKKVGGNFAVMTTRYRFSHVNLSRNITVAGDEFSGTSSNFHEGSVNFDSGTKFTKFTWNVANIYRKETLRNSRQNEIYSAIVSGDYQYTRQIAIFASTGYTKRNAVFGGVPFSGIVWRFGGRLIPGPRTVLEASYGKEFYGKTYNFNGRYQISPTISATVSFADRFRTNQAIALENFQNGIVNDAEVRQNFVDENFVRNKEWRASIQGVRGRSTFVLFATLLKSDQEEINNDFKRRAIGINWNRALSTRLNFGATVTLMEDDFAADPQKDVFMSFRSNINYNISQNVIATIEYIHSNRKQRRFDFEQRRSNYVRAAIGVTF